MTEEDAKDDAASTDENPSEDGSMMDDMEEYVKALNRFVHLVEGMDWPDSFQLAGDEKHCFQVFRTFWRQRARQHRENNERKRHYRMNLQGMNEDDVRRFFRQRFSREFFNQEDRATLNIDPEDHQPDEKHTDQDAKERQQRFREEWE